MKSREFFNAILILFIITSVVAFKKTLGDGSVYCTNTCINRVDYKIDPNGLTTVPCAVDAFGNPLPVYIWSFNCSGISCISQCNGHYTATSL